MTRSETRKPRRPGSGIRRLARTAWNTNGLARWILVVGLAMTLVFVVLAVFAPWIAPYDFNQSRGADGVKLPKLASASGDHWFGTNDQFYDIYSRVVWGARTAVMVILLSVFFSVLIGESSPQ